MSSKTFAYLVLHFKTIVRLRSLYMLCFYHFSCSSTIKLPTFNIIRQSFSTLLFYPGVNLHIIDQYFLIRLETCKTEPANVLKYKPFYFYQLCMYTASHIYNLRLNLLCIVVSCKYHFFTVLSTKFSHSSSQITTSLVDSILLPTAK